MDPQTPIIPMAAGLAVTDRHISALVSGIETPAPPALLKRKNTLFSNSLTAGIVKSNPHSDSLKYLTSLLIY